MNDTFPCNWRSPAASRARAGAPRLTWSTSVSGTKPTSLIRSSWITCAQIDPFCSRLPNSAVSLSSSPENGALRVKRSISASAIATAASADCMPDFAALKPARAELRLARAAATAASALASVVCDENPPSPSFSAAFSLIRVSSNRAWASSTRASASGTRDSASAWRATASFCCASRVPRSSSHRASPSATRVPLRNGGDMTTAEVSD